MKRKNKSTKYIFVVGGVMSGVGKGITTSSIGAILQARNLNVSLMKIDPYLNVDAGTMNPTEHGEVFVMDSGLETDQDMGNYERFLGKNLPRDNYMTSGMVYKHVIDKERSLGFKGKCVDPLYHITQEIHRRLEKLVKEQQPDVLVIEIGGTIGEHNNALFIDAARQLKIKYPQDVSFVLVGYMPAPNSIGEMKTKPLQNAVVQMNSYGVQPDFIIARAEAPVDEKRKNKLSSMTGVPYEHIISAPDLDSIYQVPINFEKDGLGKHLLKRLGLRARVADLKGWEDLNRKRRTAVREVHIAVVGKYFSTGDYVLSDAYVSIIEALRISAYQQKIKPVLHWIQTKNLTVKRELQKLKKYDGILVPGGFGSRGIDDTLKVIEFARKNKIPYFGICYGMQLMVVEYARNVAKLSKAHTTEVDEKTPHPVVVILSDQIAKLKDKDMGGSMRLGACPCVIKRGTHAFRAYKDTTIVERHRHRYEVNPEYIEQLTNKGLIFSGTSPDGMLMEIAELPKKEHPFMVGVQFHPEFLARPLAPHPLFNEFIKACK
ncbi:CTP synthase [Candidatus Nomurabacteria bacterium]|nr:CTP synthase [Candidatus Nomurabacteria bacterium]